CQTWTQNCRPPCALPRTHVWHNEYSALEAWLAVTAHGALCGWTDQVYLRCLGVWQGFAKLLQRCMDRVAICTGLRRMVHIRNLQSPEVNIWRYHSAPRTKLPMGSCWRRLIQKRYGVGEHQQAGCVPSGVPG